MTKKVALVGGGETWKEAPFEDESWDIWVHGNQYDRYEGTHRITRIFEIHDDLSEHPEEYADWLCRQGVEVVVGSKFPIPNLDNVVKFDYSSAHDLMDGQHLTSTPAYMMAQAIMDGYTEIAIYGVEMAVDNHEYFKQRPAMYAWIAFAKCMGIKVTIAGGLFTDNYVEGRDWGKAKKLTGPFTEDGFLAVADRHIRAIKEIDDQIFQLQITRASHDGARQNAERSAKVARAVEAGASVKNLTDSLEIRSNGNSRTNS